MIMQIKTIAILGGSGFVGRNLANRLVKDGYKLRILTRQRENKRKDLILLPDVALIQANIHVASELHTQLTGCDAVINLVGILNERGRQGEGFYHAHVSLTEKVIAACQANGIKRLLQMSALNADAEGGGSHYLRSKGEAEDKAHAANDLHVTSFRPSIIFGAGDSFFNRFADLLKLTPLCFPLACAGTRFAPVYVADVAAAFAKCLCEPSSYGRRYELCGPASYTLKELLEYTARCINIKRSILPLPDFLARMQATVFDRLGFAFSVVGVEKPFSMDNYLSARKDSVCSCEHLTELDIKPIAIEAIVPSYLANDNQRQGYYRLRRQARRKPD